MEPQPFVYARTADAVQRWLGTVQDAPMVAVDTETTGWDPLADRLLLVQISAGPAHPVLVVDARAVAAGVLAPLLADERVLKVFHHGAFDLRFLACAGVRVSRVADTMLAQQLLDGGEQGPAGVGLAGLASFRLGMRLDKSVRETFGDGPLTEAQLRYAADDAVATWGVFDQQWRELAAHGLVAVARLEFSLLPVLADLQLRGVAFDGARWQATLGQLEGELPQLAARLQAALVCDASPRDLFGPVAVNLDSPEQVRDALARLGVEVDSTRESVLRGRSDHPAVAALLAYREVAKLTSNWGGDWAERVAHQRTRRVHAEWRQIVSGGRLACSDPNLTQVPKQPRYRSCFGGEPGRVLVVADYSQQELRVVAALAGDEAMVELFRRGGDLHASTAATVFGVEEARVTPAQRAAAKALNFGLLYGMGAAGFARATGMSPAAAQATMQRYFATFPHVAQWLADVEASGRRTGKVRTPLGRVRAVGGEGNITTLARNAPVQGAAADMTKLALVEVERRLRAVFGDVCDDRGVPPDGTVLVVHDELVVEVPEEHAPEAVRAVQEGMLVAASRILGNVPAAVDVALRRRWGTTGPEEAFAA